MAQRGRPKKLPRPVIADLPEDIKEDLESNRKYLAKRRKQNIKFSKSMADKAKTLFEKYDIRGMQELFDHLVVSGVVYFKREIVEVVRARIPEWQERYSKSRISNFGKEKNPEEYDDYYRHTFFMYEKDHAGLANFCIEENLKKFWTVQILFDEFTRENSIILNHIKKCQDLNIMERKKKTVRLLNDQYITMLNEQDSNSILELLTKKYDEKTYGDKFVQEEMLEALKKSEKAKQEEDIDASFEKKLLSLRMSRARKLTLLIDPIDLEETEEELEETEIA